MVLDFSAALQRFQPILSDLFFRKKLTRKDAARSIGMSETQLNRLFPRTCAGLTFQQAQKTFPLITAARRIVSEDTRLTDVVLDLEYYDPTSHGRVFKKVWGMPPAEFRRQFRGLPTEHPVVVRVRAGNDVRLSVHVLTEGIRSVHVGSNVIVIGSEN
jgi:AraC-like DNA-binding protein